MPVTLWTDDFESGNALSVSYTRIIDARSKSDVGVGGGWGAESNSTLSAGAKYYAEFSKNLPGNAPQGSDAEGWYFSVEMDVDHRDIADNDFGFALFQLGRFVSGTTYHWILSLEHGVSLEGGPNNDLYLLFRETGPGSWGDWDRAINVITPGTFQTIRCCGKTSSWDAGTQQRGLDGWVKVYVDDVEVMSVADVPIYIDIGPIEGGYWDFVMIGPMGRADNLSILDECAAAVFVGECAGGGAVPLAADPATGGTLGSACKIEEWVEVTPIAGTTKKWTVVDDNLAYSDGWREPRIARRGSFTRALSDRRGGFESGTCHYEGTDTDRVFRQMLTAGPLRNARVEHFLIDEALRRAGGTARRVANFLLRNAQTGPDLTFSFDAESILGTKFSPFFLEKILPDDVLDVATHGSTLPEALIGKRPPQYFGTFSDQVNLGAVPLTYIGQETMYTGMTWDVYLIQKGAISNVLRLYGATGGTPPTEYGLLPTTTYGVDWLVPGYTGWAAETGSSLLYRLRNGKRYAIIYGRGPRSDAAKAGTVPLRADICATEDLGNGTGLVIDDAARIVMFIILNLIIQTSHGAWATTIPTIGGTPYSLINTTSFEGVKAIHDALISGGLKGAFVIAEDLEGVLTSEVLRRVMVSYDIQLAENRHGQVMASTYNPLSSVTTAFKDEMLGGRIVRGSVRTVRRSADFANYLIVRHTKNLVEPLMPVTPAEGELLPKETEKIEWLSGDVPFLDGPSQTQHNELVSRELELYGLRDSTAASFIAMRELERSKNEPKDTIITVDAEGHEIELGDLITVESFENDTTAAEKVRVRRHESREDYYVNLECENVANFGVAVGVGLSAGTATVTGDMSASTTTGPAVGLAAGTSTAVGVSAQTVAGRGDSSGTSIVSGIGATA
jgi:hypothetical protein